MSGDLPVGWIALGALAALALLAFFGNYNALVRLRNHCRESWAGIDVQLRRRYDLVPNLVACVRGYAAHERQVLERVVELRNRCFANAGPVASQSADEKPFVQALRGLLALVEGYPDLKASANFLSLQRELADTEDRIAAARRFFNGNVREYNNKVETFPSAVVASLFDFRREDFWDVEEATVREAPRVAVS